MSSMQPNTDDIPGTIIFDGKQAMKGYASEQDVFLVQLGRKPRRVSAQ